MNAVTRGNVNSSDSRKASAYLVMTMLLAGSGLAVLSNRALLPPGPSVPGGSSWNSTPAASNIRFSEIGTRPAPQPCRQGCTPPKSARAGLISPDLDTNIHVQSHVGQVPLSPVRVNARHIDLRTANLARVHITARHLRPNNGYDDALVGANAASPIGPLSGSTPKSSLGSGDSIQSTPASSPADLIPKAPSASPENPSAPYDVPDADLSLRGEQSLDVSATESGDGAESALATTQQAAFGGIASTLTPSTTSNAQTVSQVRQTRHGVEFEVPVQMNGTSLGKVTLLIQGADMDYPDEIHSDISVRLDSLLKLIGAKMDQQQLLKLTGSAAATNYVTLNDLRSNGIDVSFDRHDRLNLKSI